ncbi:N-acetylmuramoyl-L-alanine amidase [Paraclostridium tenue]|uniref:SH3b domain-containing protein n=1 Tax=Paraclostridium tenue TaxID=1737 RepID=A0ABP3XPK5_9FIRM
MRTNMTDAGHGGKDSGAPGLHGCLEKNIVLEVSNKVNDYLKTQDIKNINTRTTDIFLTLNERSDKANNLGVNSFVSIHCNSSDDPKAHGLEIFCYKFKYRQLADCILEEIKKEGLYTQLREGGVKEDNLHVVRETNMPACLVELGFITNEKDYNLIMNNKDKFAKAIAKGICKFNGVTWKETTGPSSEGFKNGDYSGRKARVIADVLNVRYDRGTQYNVIGQVKNGDIVNLQYCLNGWISIEGFKGNKGLGYVSSKYLQII